jgi:hypothetical protein
MAAGSKNNPWTHRRYRSLIVSFMYDFCMIHFHVRGAWLKNEADPRLMKMVRPREHIPKHEVGIRWNKLIIRWNKSDVDVDDGDALTCLHISLHGQSC